MKTLLIAMVVAAVGLAAPRYVAAQHPRGFVTAGISWDVNDQHFAGIGGGVLFDLAKSWVSVGGQADLFFSNDYVAGRGELIVQANLIRHRAVRPFVIGGIGWGELSGLMLGAGVEVWPRGRVGFRASVHDRGMPYTAHQPSVQLGIVWR